MKVCQISPATLAFKDKFLFTCLNKLEKKEFTITVIITEPMSLLAVSHTVQEVKCILSVGVTLMYTVGYTLFESTLGVSQIANLHTEC